MCFRFRSFPFQSRFLSSADLPVPATQPLFLPFRSSRFCLTVASPVPVSALASPVSPSVPPGFPCFPFGFRTWLFCWFPFVPPSSAPAAASLVLAFSRFLTSPSFRPFPFPFASFRPLRFPSDYSAFCPFFSLLSRFPLATVLPVRFPLPFRLFPCVSSGSRYSALCSSFLPFPFCLAVAISFAAACLSV